MSTRKGKAMASDIRIVEIKECGECPHIMAIGEHVMLCDAGQPKFVVSENGNLPHFIPFHCPLPKKEADRDG